MKYLNLIVVIFLFSCGKEVQVIKESSSNPTQPVVILPTKLVFTVSSLDSISNTNKNSSWYQTNKSFDELFNHKNTPFFGFQSTSNGFIPFSIANTANYWNDYGTYLYYDFNKDGKKDVWSYSYKAPWPSNQKGLSVYSEYNNDNILNIQEGLTQVRKSVITDLDNDGFKDIVMFSHGYDAKPFPGDSVGIFYPKDLKYQYLSDEIGFYHSGAVGDINNDGLVDIIGYGFKDGKGINRPTIYINNGNRKFTLSKSNTINFSQTDGYMTMELYDIDNDSFLDMILGNGGIIKIIKNKNGIFDISTVKTINNDGMPLSFIFYDFNKDGVVDILTNNTYDYNGYNLKLYISNGNDYIEDTEKYFSKTKNTSSRTWIKWIRMFDVDKDGDLDIVGDGLYGTFINQKMEWINSDGKFN
jgi:hypothetical protein